MKFKGIKENKQLKSCLAEYKYELLPYSMTLCWHQKKTK
jgi:hypothetical protein